MMAANIVYEIAVELGWFGLIKERHIYILENGASPTAALGGIFLFYLFKKIEINKFSRLIRFGGQHSIGILLICFPSVVPRAVVYDTIMRGAYYWSGDTWKFLFAYACTVILTCILGIILDWLYEMTIGQIVLNIITRFSPNSKDSKEKKYTL